MITLTLTEVEFIAAYNAIKAEYQRQETNGCIKPEIKHLNEIYEDTWKSLFSKQVVNIEV